MVTSRQILVYFKPSNEISTHIESLNLLITKQFDNNYRSHVDGRWESHLMVFLGRFYAKDINKVLEVVEKTIKKIKSFEISTSDLRVDGKFIFLDIDKNSQLKLVKIHDLLIEKLNHLREHTIPVKYRELWSSLTDRQKYLVKTSGLPYEYIPHFTIVRLQEKNVTNVMAKLQTKRLNPLIFHADEIKIAIDDDSINSDWKTLKSIKLNHR